MKGVYFFFILYIKLKLVELCRFTLAVAVVQSATKEQILLLAILLAVTSDKWCWVQMLEKWSQMDGARVGVRGWKPWAPSWLCLLDAVPLRLSGLSRRKVSWAGWMLEAWRIFFGLIPCLMDWLHQGGIWGSSSRASRLCLDTLKTRSNLSYYPLCKCQ